MDYKTSTKRIMISIVVFIFSFFSTVLDLARISQKEKEDLKKASYIKADRFLFTLTCITVRYLFFSLHLLRLRLLALPHYLQN